MALKYILLLLISYLLVGCKNPLDTEPTNAVETEKAITDLSSAQSALVGCYACLTLGQAPNDNSDYYSLSLPLYGDLPADIIQHIGTFPTFGEINNRNILANNTNIANSWAQIYRCIHAVNSLIEKQAGVSMSPETRNQLLGEAYFLRALHYFNLIRLFAQPYSAANRELPGVPLILKAGVDVNNTAGPRASIGVVYDQILKDISAAETLLTIPINNGRATPLAATALAARVYLYMQNWQMAQQKATTVIASGQYSLNPYELTFRQKFQPESIFEVAYTTYQTNAIAFWYYPRSLGGRYAFIPTETLINAYDEDDTRKSVNINQTDDGDIYANKYYRIQTSDDNIIVLRLAEMYLIRAEAWAKLGNLNQGLADLNAVRKRAAVPDVTVTDVDELLLAIENERMLEFPFEGHRWHDLVRTGRAADVLGPSVTIEKQVFPIPQYEMDTNPACIQNPGY